MEDYSYEILWDEYYLSRGNIPRVKEMHESVLKAKKKLKEDLGGVVVKVPFIDEIDRKIAILRLLRLRLQSQPEGQMVIDKFLKMSKEAISQNLTDREIIISGRTYQAGTKITKLLTRMASGFSYNFEKSVGMFANPTKDIKEINLSIQPLDMIMAGAIGESCYSVDGENQMLPFIIARSHYWAVAYNEDFTVRMYVMVDADRKIYGLNYTYPQQSNLMAYSVDKFFQEKGYKRMDEYSEFFQYSAYYVDATRNPYPELGKDRITRHPEMVRPSMHGIADGTKGCAITGDPKHLQLSYRVCASCEQIFERHSMEGEYCYDCHEENENYCWDCGDHYDYCTCDGEE